MRIVMLAHIAGPGVSAAPGVTVDWPDEAEAIRLIERGLAVPAAAPAGVECAVAEPARETRRRTRRPD